MRDILAYCADVRVWSPAVRYAAELAANLDASLTGIHVTPPLPAREPRGTPPSLLAEFVAYAQEEVRAAMQAGSRFSAWARELGVASPQWQVALGDPVDVLGMAGNWNDVLVIERRVGDREDTTDLIGELLLSGIACIAVPENAYAIGRLERIMVAFDGAPASVRALHAATPMLQRAAHVILLQGRWYDRSDEEPRCRPTFDPVQHLAARGVAVEVEMAETPGAGAGDVILESASRNRADLLVIGAEGKRRLGDCHLAALPSHLLRYAGVPLYMTQ